MRWTRVSSVREWHQLGLARGSAKEHFLEIQPSFSAVVFGSGYTLLGGRVLGSQVAGRGQGQRNDRRSVLGDTWVAVVAVAEVEQA
jgi:hypothetical protein